MQQIESTVTSLKQRGDQYTQAATSGEPEADFLMQLVFLKHRHLMIVKMRRLCKAIEKEAPPCSSFQSDAGVGGELRERVEMLKEEKVSKSEADKEKANSRLGGYMGHLKEARGELQVARRNRIEDLEKLLAFEEREVWGFATLDLEVRLK